MISTAEADLINRCLSDIPPTGHISRYQFLEADIDDFLSQLALTTDDFSRPWKTFFTSDQINICGNCRSEWNECSCNNPDKYSDVYYIDTSQLVSEYIDAIDSVGWFEVVSKEAIDDTAWRVELTSDSLGNITLRILLDGDTVTKIDSDPVEKSIVSVFTNQKEIAGTEFSYWWSELLDEENWSEIHDNLLGYQKPLSLNICRYDSNAAQNNTEDIEDSFKDYFQNNGLETDEDAQLSCPSVNKFVNTERITLVGHENDEYILICNCDVRPDHWHMHLYSEEDLVDVNNSKIAKESREKMREKVKRYNTLVESSKDIPAIAKLLSVVMGLTLIGPLLQLLNSINLGLSTKESVMLFGAVLLLQAVIAIPLLYFALSPIYEKRRFSWDLC